MTTVHANRRRHEIFLDGSSEIIRANGRMAIRMSLKPQIIQMQLITAEVGRDAFLQVQSVRSSIKLMLSQLSQGGVVLVGAAADAINQIAVALGEAKTTAQLAKATAMMQSTSNVWHCEPDPLDPDDIGERTDVRQLDDAAVGASPAHVYLETHALGSRDNSFAPRARAVDDDAPPRYELTIKTWVGVADGLPLRSEFALPGGHTQRVEFDYANVEEIVFPACATES